MPIYPTAAAIWHAKSPLFQKKKRAFVFPFVFQPWMGIAPLHIGIKAVINGAALILVLETLLRGDFTLSVYLDDALGREFHVRMDEHPQAIRFVRHP